MTPATRNVEWFPDVFNEIFNYGMAPKNKGTQPAINVIENEKNYRVEVAAPGMQKEDLNVKLDNDHNLVISMEKKSNSNNNNNNGNNKNNNNSNNNENCCKKEDHYLRREFAYSQFKQTMSLPEDANEKAISAKVENGVLSINIPKKEPQKEEENSRMITIQ